MKRDAAYDLLCRLTAAAGLPPTSWITMSAADWQRAVSSPKGPLS